MHFSSSRRERRAGALVGVVEAKDDLVGGNAGFREAVGNALFGTVVLDVDFAVAHVYVDHTAVNALPLIPACIRSS